MTYLICAVVAVIMATCSRHYYMRYRLSTFEKTSDNNFFGSDELIRAYDEKLHYLKKD